MGDNSELERDTKSSNLFIIKTGDGDYRLRAEDEEDREDWVLALNQVLLQVKISLKIHAEFVDRT